MFKPCKKSLIKSICGAVIIAVSLYLVFIQPLDFVNEDNVGWYEFVLLFIAFLGIFLASSYIICIENYNKGIK